MVGGQAWRAVGVIASADKILTARLVPAPPDQGVGQGETRAIDVPDAKRALYHAVAG